MLTVTNKTRFFFLMALLTKVVLLEVGEGGRDGGLLEVGPGGEKSGGLLKVGAGGVGGYFELHTIYK